MTEFAGKPFRLVPGGTEVMGTGGPVYRYMVYVQRGLPIHGEDVARLIDATLGDKRGWTRHGTVQFQRADSDAPTICFLAAPDQVDILCAPLQTEGQVSCSLGSKVVLNVDRWKTAVPHWTGSIKSYREMVINHEFGHRIGQGHRFCPGPGGTAPVMEQQTYGLQGCKENSWPLDSEVASL